MIQSLLLMASLFSLENYHEQLLERINIPLGFSPIERLYHLHPSKNKAKN
jgi:hypothetical protein